MADPQKYRDQAERLRREAEGMTDPVEQRMMRKLADLYENLGRHAENKREESKKR